MEDADRVGQRLEGASLGVVEFPFGVERDGIGEAEASRGFHFAAEVLTGKDQNLVGIHR